LGFRPSQPFTRAAWVELACLERRTEMAAFLSTRQRLACLSLPEDTPLIEMMSRRVVMTLFTLVLLASATVAQALPAGWSTADIGNVGAAGFGSGSGGAVTATGAGADIWGTADAFRFVYTALNGDGSIVTQVTSVQYVADWTKAGVMMRASLAANAAQAMMLVSANKGLAFQRRVSTGGISTNTSGGAAHAPYFVRLTRAGSKFTAAKSVDGATWTTVGSETISMPSTIYVGVVISSHVAGTLAKATFEDTAVAAATPPAGGTTETIVFLRHGEKPSGGYGQITCQGLQRALALPDVLASHFGAPDAIFEPNPSPKYTHSAGSFYYVRPLATIEPTAIRLGMPVNAAYGFTDIVGLQGALLASTNASATIFVAWEHLELQKLVQNIMDSYDAGVTVPAWPSGDYDSLYVVRLTHSGDTVTAQFEHDAEGLNNLPTTCP
jgi:regulation of enolase protein 1 (concanavalin A-like superfamily)